MYMISTRLCAVWNILIFAGDSDFWLWLSFIIFIWPIRNSYSLLNSFLSIVSAGTILLFHRVNVWSVFVCVCIRYNNRNLYGCGSAVFILNSYRNISCTSLVCIWNLIRVYSNGWLLLSFSNSSCDMLFNVIFIWLICIVFIALQLYRRCRSLMSHVIWIANCYRNFHVILRTVRVGNSNLNVYGSRSLSVDRCLTFINCNCCTVCWRFVVIVKLDFTFDFFIRRNLTVIIQR